jgi:hypothetical chaperone protein
MYGIDFGTSNTVVTTGNGASSKILDLGEGGVLPSLLHFERDRAPTIGSSAIADYASALDRYRGAGNLYSRFRFFQGLKLALKDPYFEGSRIFGEHRLPEELVGIFLRELKRRADAETGRPSSKLVLGRPVVLSADPGMDRLLETRFDKAARIAGFSEVAFVPEPVGAAVSLLGSLQGLVLVFDFGGGTLDITLARLGPRSVDILGSVGMDLGGFILNEDISRVRLRRHFGMGGSWRSESGRWLPLPSWLANQITSFHALPLGDIAKTRSAIKELLPDVRPADRPGLRGLADFLDRNLGFSLFAEIDRAKIALSEREEDSISFAVPPHVSFVEALSRQDFEILAAPRVEAARALVHAALRGAGVEAGEVLRLVRVGGSCRIPAFIRMLEAEFPGRVVEGEVFTSIASGLLQAAELGLAN